MAVVFSNVNEQALQFTPDEKLALIESLVISLDSDPDAEPQEVSRARDEEIARRIEAMDRGEFEMIDGDEVFARLRAILARLNHPVRIRFTGPAMREVGGAALWYWERYGERVRGHPLTDRARSAVLQDSTAPQMRRFAVTCGCRLWLADVLLRAFTEARNSDNK